MSAVCAVKLTPQNTTVAFSVPWWGVSTVRGQFAHLAGELIIPNGDISSASVRLDVEAGSIRTGVRLRDRHLRGPQFLDAARYPVIHFSSTNVERVNGAIEVSGLLTLCGAQREVVARCPIGYADGQGIDATVAVGTVIEVPRLPHGVGLARGVHKLNPMLQAIGSLVSVAVNVRVPAARLLPALLPALGR